MRERLSPLWIGLLAVGVLAVVGEVAFDRPLRRIQEFRFEESSPSITVQIAASTASGTTSEGGSRVELQSVSRIEVFDRNGVARLISPALLFEVLAAEPRVLQNIELVGPSGSTSLASSLDSTAMEYQCCGEDSRIVVAVDPATPDLPALANPILTFEIVPSRCIYDLPKVFCRFATLDSGGPVVIDGGSILLADFSGLDLRGAVFLNVDLRGSSFAGADLRGAMFRSVNLIGVELTGANVDQTIFRRIDSDTMLGRP